MKKFLSQSPVICLVGANIYGIGAGYMFSYLPLTISLFMCGSGLIIVKRYGIKKTLLLTLSFLYGFTYTRWLLHISPDDIFNYTTGKEVIVTGVIDEPPVHSGYYTKAFLKTRSIHLRGKVIPVSGRVILNLFNEQMAVEYGDIVQVKGHLKPVRGFKNPDLFDYGEYMFLKGIHGKINISKPQDLRKVGFIERSFLRTIYRWREGLLEVVDNSLAPQEGSIFRAMILGSSERLTSRTREIFIRAGVAHLLVISGLHIGFIAMLTFSAIRYFILYLPVNILEELTIHILPSHVAALSTIPVITFYTLISGNRIPSLRAFIMTSIYLLCMSMERNHNILNTFMVATMAVLLWTPLSLFNISFQYSYIAVLTIIVMGERLNSKRPSRNKRSLFISIWNRWASLFLLTLWVNIFLLPLNSHYFNTFSWPGFISNLIITPYAGFIVLPVSLVSITISFIFNLDKLPLITVNTYLIIGLIKITAWFANLPFSIIHVPSLPAFFIFPVYGALIVISLAQSWRRPVLLILSILLFMRIGISCLYHADRDRISFIDVGQGESIFIEFATGETMLIDGGGLFGKHFDTGRSIVAPFLWNRWTYTIDYLVASHPQRDHIKGLTYIIRNFAVKEVWTDGVHTNASKAFDRAIKEKGIPVKTINKNLNNKIIGNCRIIFLNPPAPLPPWKVNDLSIVMKIRCGTFSILLTGDIERRAIYNIVQGRDSLKSTILKIPHHGSKSSFDRRFMYAVHPSTGIVSAGFMNPYHHPSKYVVHEYEKMGTKIYNTATDGAITVEFSDSLKIRTYNDYVMHRVDFGSISSLIHGEISNLHKLSTRIFM